MNSDTDRVLEKIRKLLALANGASGPEAEAALAAATRLMDEHDLDQATVSEHEVNRVYQAKCFERLGRLTGLEKAASAVLTNCFHVELVWSEERREIEIFGREHHIKLAGYVYVVLCRQFREKWEASGNTRGSDAYFQGMAAMVVANLKRELGDRRGLIAMGSERKRAFHAHYGEMDSVPTTEASEDLFRQGAWDGRDIRVRRPLAQSAQPIAGRLGCNKCDTARP